MSLESVRTFLAERGYADRILTFDVSSATVELAAQAVGVPPAHIAKTVSFHAAKAEEEKGSGEDGACRAVLVVAAGDAKVNSSKFKHAFGYKPTMLGHDEVEDLTGHPVGGVCPFAVAPGVRVWLDESLRRFEVVYPAAGTGASAVRLTPEELQDACGEAFAGWCDVCKTALREPGALGEAAVGDSGKN